MSVHDHDHHCHNPKFPRTLRTVYQRLQTIKQDADPHGWLLLRQDDLNFIGASNRSRATFDVPGFRGVIAALLHLEEFRTVQVVGDCRVGFTAAGYRKAREIVQSIVMDGGGGVRDDTVLEYGYTACEHDTNWIINEMIATTPQLRSRTIANLVYMSSVAVEEWGCEATDHVRNFVLAYDHEGETAFGSDMWLSDLLLSSRSMGDTLVCLEGGPQAFAQAVNVILQGAAVVVVTGPGMRVRAAQGNFSAACMLILLYEQLQTCFDKRNTTSAEKEAIRSRAVGYLDEYDDCRPPKYQSRYDLVQKALSKLLTGLEKLDVLQVEYVR